MARDWKRWFEDYAGEWRRGEFAGVAARYGPVFLFATPGKTATYTNDARFLGWLERVRSFHLEAGLERVEVVTVRITTLGSEHVLVTVTWAVRFERTAALRIQFDISYLLAVADEPLILAYLSHEDQRAAMQRYGVL